MHVGSIGHLLRVFEAWYLDASTFGDVELLLGSPPGLISGMLIKNGVMRSDSKPNKAFTCQQILNVLLFYLALRGRIRVDDESIL